MNSKGVYNIKKIIVYVVIATCLFGFTVSCQNEQLDKNIREMIVGKTYTYEKGGFYGSFDILINDDGTYTYYEGSASSYLGMGTWTLEGDVLCLSDDDEFGYSLVNYFRFDGANLVFQSENSSNFIYVKVADGARFLNKKTK